MNQITVSNSVQAQPVSGVGNAVRHTATRLFWQAMGVWAQKGERPDPFRFWPPRIRRACFPFYRLENLFFLYGVYHLKPLILSAESRRHLESIHSAATTLVVANHNGYIDPHTLLEISFQAHFSPKWVAGIEPFEKSPLYRWHMQGVGGFSLDRGAVDKLSLTTAQAVLALGEHPLIIFPEGEAHYTHHRVRPFYEGAASMALKSLKSHVASSQPVQILPIAIRYAFVGSPQKPIVQAIGRLAKVLGETLPASFNTPAECHASLVHLAQAGLAQLARTELGDAFPSGQTPFQAISGLQQALAGILSAEHGVEAPRLDESGGFSDADLMRFKNRTRSLISRKLYAPAPEELKTLLLYLETIMQKSTLDFWDRWLLRRLCLQWIGVYDETKPDREHISQLMNHLRQQESYATLKAKADETTRVRWQRQLIQCRTIKLLGLVMEDLEQALYRPIDEWHRVEDLLVKLEFLFLRRFFYRGPKTVRVEVGEPLDVGTFAREKVDMSSKAQTAELNRRMTERVRELLAKLL